MASTELPQPGPKLQSASLLGMALVLAVFGQITLLKESLPLSHGLLLYAAAISLFLFALRGLAADLLLAPIPRTSFQPDRPRLALWFTSLALVLITVQSVNAPEKSPLQSRLIVVAWLLGIALLSVSVLRFSRWRWPAGTALPAWWQTHWRETLAVAALVLLALGLRLYNIQFHPYSFINDEGEIGKEATRILTGERTNFFDVAWASQPVWSFVPAALSVWLFGHTAFAIRLVSALLGTLTVLFLYLLGRELFDRATAFLAAGVLLALPFHLHFSRLGVNNGGDAFFSTLTLWLTYRAVRRGSLPAYLLAGLMTGAALYTYLGSRLAIALAFGTVGYVALSQRGYLRTHWRHLLIFAGTALLVALPMAAYFWKTPDQFMARLNAEGILNNGYLQRQAAAGQGYGATLLDQFAKSSLVYVARAAGGGFFGSPRPYLTSMAAIFFVLGMGYVLWRILEPRYMTLFVWFWTVVILGSTLTVGPPSSQRLLMSAPALALLVAVGLRKTAAAAAETRLITARAGLALCALVVFVTGLQGIYFYFGEYRLGHYFEDASNELTYESSQYTASLGADYRLYLIGDPRVFIGFANFDYFASDLEKQDFNNVTPEAVAALPQDRGAFFLAIPERRADLEQLAQWVPGGQWIEVHRRTRPAEMLYYAYQIPPGRFARP